MGQYDIALKSMLRSGGRGLLKSLGIAGPLRRLDIELPSAKERHLDFLAELWPGQLVHIEFQSSKDAHFVFRMLGYYGEILERLAAEQRPERLPPPSALEIRQILLYLGEDRWTHRSALDHANLKFRFDVVDVIGLDAEPLVATGDVGDAVFAILCRDGTSSAMIRAILQRIAAAPPEERSDALAQLLVLAHLRQASTTIAEVQAAMTIMVNGADIPLLREPIDRAFAAGRAEGEAAGRAEGLAKGLVLVLQAKFGPLPEGPGRGADAAATRRRGPHDAACPCRRQPGSRAAFRAGPLRQPKLKAFTGG